MPPNAVSPVREEFVHFEFYSIAVLEAHRWCGIYLKDEGFLGDVAVLQQQNVRFVYTEELMKLTLGWFGLFLGERVLQPAEPFERFLCLEL